MRKTWTIRKRDPNSWFPDTGEHCIMDECGHKHRTLDAAVRCYRHLTRTLSDGSRLLRWYHCAIEPNWLASGKDIEEIREAISQITR